MFDFSDLARSGTAPARYKPKSASKHSSPLIYGHDAGYGGGARPASRAGHDISDINIGLRLDRLTLGAGMARERGCLSTGDLSTYNARNTPTREASRNDDALGDRVRDYIKRKPVNLTSPPIRPYADEPALPLSGRSGRGGAEEGQLAFAYGSPIPHVPVGNEEQAGNAFTAKLGRDRSPTKTSQRVRASSAARHQPTSAKADANARPRVRSANATKKATIAHAYLKSPTPTFQKSRRTSTSAKPSSARSRAKQQPALSTTEPGASVDRRMERPLSKQRSFNEFMFREGAAAERPPSRQKHAFPTHLADLDFRPQKAFEVQSESSQTNSLRENVRMANSIKRPPSRHKPAGSSSVSYDGQRSIKHDGSRSSLWQPAHHDPEVDGFADITPEHPCPFVIQITNSTDERAARSNSTSQAPAADGSSTLSPPPLSAGQMARLASEINEGSSVDGNGSLGEVFRRKRVEKQSRLLQPTVKTINFDQHPAENSYRVRTGDITSGITLQYDGQLHRAPYGDYSDGEIAEDVSSDNDDCSVLTDLTNPTDLRSEAPQSLALESTLGEDFLSLFADGSEFYMYESQNHNHNSWKQV